MEQHLQNVFWTLAEDPRLLKRQTNGLRMRHSKRNRLKIGKEFLNRDLHPREEVLKEEIFPHIWKPLHGWGQWGNISIWKHEFYMNFIFQNHFVYCIYILIFGKDLAVQIFLREGKKERKKKARKFVFQWQLIFSQLCDYYSAL